MQERFRRRRIWLNLVGVCGQTWPGKQSCLMKEWELFPYFWKNWIFVYVLSLIFTQYSNIHHTLYSIVHHAVLSWAGSSLVSLFSISGPHTVKCSKNVNKSDKKNRKNKKNLAIRHKNSFSTEISWIRAKYYSAKQNKQPCEIVKMHQSGKFLYSMTNCVTWTSIET